MRDRVFVVMGTAGEYSESACWNVCAFLDRARAEAFAREATEHVARLLSDEDFHARVWGETSAADLDLLAKYDPNLVDVHENGREPSSLVWRFPWPSYGVIEVPLADVDSSRVLG